MGSLLQELLEEQGYEANSASSELEAFRKVARDSFDLIFTDVRIPGLSGLDLLADLRKLRPEEAVIVFTAFGSKDIHRKAMERRVNACLDKLVHLRKLMTLIQ